MIGGADALFILAVPTLGALIPLPPPALAPFVTNVKRYLFFKSLKTLAPQLLINLAALGVGASATVTVAQVDAIAQLLAGIPQDALAKLAYDPGTSQSVGAEAYGILVLAGNDPIFAAPSALTAFWSRVGGFYDDGGLVAAITVFRAALESWRKVVQAQIEKDEKASALQKIEKEEREMRVLEAYPLRETADAAERLDALLAHLNEPRNVDHYRFAVWNERSGATDTTLIGLALAGLIDPTPVGMVGDQLAVPVRMPAGSKLAHFYTDSVIDLVNQLVRDDDEHILPTPALYAESIVGTCCSCEDTLERAAQLDLDRSELNNKILELETKRLRARLDSTPPQLDLEIAAPPAIRVDVTNPSPA
jgi:hypothetical protein